MELSIVVHAKGNMTERFSAGTVVTEPMTRAWEPLKTCDDPHLAYALGETYSNYPPERKVVTKVRENAAKDIAEALTKLLLESMAEHDTTNGYYNNE